MKLTNLLIAAVAAATVSSCSLIKDLNIPGFKKSSPTPEKTTETVVTEKTTKPEETKSEKKNNSDKKNNKNMQSDSKIGDRLNGEWIITSAAGKTIPTTDEMPYITFEKGTGKFYASNGCNVLNGIYKIADDGSLSFENVLSTMKLCPENDYEAPLTKALSGSEKINIKINDLGHETYLRFFSSKGVELLSARKHNMDFLNGNWLITSVGGKAIPAEDATLFIDINELKVHGNTGCNFFNGVLYINPDKSNAIDFSNLASTRMACPNMQQESAIMLALEETAGAIEGSEGRVMLLNSSGKELMTLKPAPVEAE